MNIRKWTWNFMEGRAGGGRLGNWFESFILTVILLNVIAVIIGSVESIQKRCGFWLDGFELISVIIFTVEYLARLWSCVSDSRFQGAIRGRIKHSLGIISIIDLLAILPFYLPFVGIDLRSLRILRLLRILRIARLGRYYNSLKIIKHVLYHNRRELIMTFALLFTLLVFASTLLHCCENTAQPEIFSSIPATMWWAVTTVTTVGYGDMCPITPAGKLCAGLISILGIITFALPTGIIGAGFVQEVQERQKSRKCPHCGKEL
ncbi:MAG: ion transporter [Sedimentisphaerales bacterium]|nr:ion transporter [Sedimentisphaerales bacterium]